MANIAIIDDNIEQSDTLRKKLSRHIQRHGSSLGVITQFPFQDIEEYFDFIDNSNICVLILDEKLNDQSLPDGNPVNYLGNELVTALRKRLLDFPIFMITTFSDTEDVIAKFSEFEYIINREEFNQEGEKYIGILIRSAQRYLKEHTEELSEFDRLTRELAGGSSDPEILKRFEALQVKLELPISGFDDRREWLETYEKHIEELDNLKEELTRKLSR
jgi:hypothetical protein